MYVGFAVQEIWRDSVGNSSGPDEDTGTSFAHTERIYSSAVIAGKRNESRRCGVSCIEAVACTCLFSDFMRTVSRAGGANRTVGERAVFSRVLVH